MESMTSACHVCFCRTLLSVSCVSHCRCRCEADVESKGPAHNLIKQPQPAQSQRPLCGLCLQCLHPLLTLTGAQNLHGHPSNLCEPCAVRSLTDPFTYAVRCAIHDVPGGRRPCGGAPRRPLGRARGRSVHGGWPGLLHHHWQHRDGCGLHRGRDWPLGRRHRRPDRRGRRGLRWCAPPVRLSCFPSARMAWPGLLCCRRR